MRSNFSYFSRRYMIRPTYRLSNEMTVNPLMSIYVWCISIKADRRYGIWFLSGEKWHVHALIAKGQSSQPAKRSSLLQKDQPFFLWQKIFSTFHPVCAVCGKYGRGEVDLPKSVYYWVSLPIFSHWMLFTNKSPLLLFVLCGFVDSARGEYETAHNRLGHTNTLHEMKQKCGEWTERTRKNGF